MVEGAHLIAISAGAYNLLKFTHVLAAVAWVGGDILLQVLGRRIQKMDDPRRMGEFARDIAFVGLRFITPLTIVLILSAIGLIWFGPYGLSDAWVKLAVLGYVITLITGAAYLGPTSGKIGKLLETKPADDPAVARPLNKLILVARLDVVVLILLVADMVFKPWS
jgi:uncharacterized membrane protein